MKLFLRKWLPKKSTLSESHKNSRLKNIILHPAIWHLNRHSVAKGCAIGLFFAFIPLPVQMLMSAIFAIWFRANFPIALLMTWVTNPLTYIPAGILVYRVGKLFTGNPEAYQQVHEFKLDFAHPVEMGQNFILWLKSLGPAFLVGTPIVATVSAIMGYIAVRVIWSVSVRLQLRRRREKALKNQQK